LSTGHPTGFSVFDRAFCKSDAVSHMSPSKKRPTPEKHITYRHADVGQSTKVIITES